jgi:methylaspartate mutase epsilon subunit
MNIQNKKIDEDDFLNRRKEVLAMWPTGKEIIDLDEAISYQKSLPPHKNLVNRISNAKKAEQTLFHNLAGFTTLDQQTDLLLHLQNIGQVDALFCIYDSFTRTGRFERAEEVIKECERSGKNLLNGFPIVNYGIRGNRKLVESVDRPVGAAGPAVDSRLVSEIALASGYTQLQDISFIVFETYTKTASLEEILGNFQYINRLVGYYEERGVQIAIRASSAASASNAPGVAPPSLGIAGRVIGALLVATQGPKHIVLMNSSDGNIAQDVATSITGQKMAREYLDRFGFTEVELFMSNGCMGGPYPLDFDQAFSQVVYAGIVGALSGSQLVELKTFDETRAIPPKENQAKSAKGTRMMYNIMKTPGLDFVNSKEVRTEIEVYERETKSIVEKVLELGDGDPLVGAVKAYEYGIMDNPVANNPRVKAKVMGVKDAHGAVRYLNCGNLPFTKDMMEFHREKIAEREKLLGKKADYDTIVSDMRALITGEWLHH